LTTAPDTNDNTATPACWCCGNPYPAAHTDPPGRAPWKGRVSAMRHLPGTPGESCQRRPQPHSRRTPSQRRERGAWPSHPTPAPRAPPSRQAPQDDRPAPAVTGRSMARPCHTVNPRTTRQLWSPPGGRRIRGGVDQWRLRPCGWWAFRG